MTDTPLLSIEGLTAHYGDFQALFWVDLHLDHSCSVVIIGTNEAGKSALMRAICGIGATGHGKIELDGVDLQTPPAPEALRRRVAIVPEGRMRASTTGVDPCRRFTRRS